MWVPCHKAHIVTRKQLWVLSALLKAPYSVWTLMPPIWFPSHHGLRGPLYSLCNVLVLPSWSPDARCNVCTGINKLHQSTASNCGGHGCASGRVPVEQPPSGLRSSLFSSGSAPLLCKEIGADRGLISSHVPSPARTRLTSSYTADTGGVTLS